MGYHVRLMRYSKVPFQVGEAKAGGWKGHSQLFRVGRVQSSSIAEFNLVRFPIKQGIVFSMRDMSYKSNLILKMYCFRKFLNFLDWNLV